MRIRQLITKVREDLERGRPEETIRLLYGRREIKKVGLDDLVYSLVYRGAGYCSKEDVIGVCELLEKRLWPLPKMIRSTYRVFMRVEILMGYSPENLATLAITRAKHQTNYHYEGETWTARPWRDDQDWWIVTREHPRREK
jgi:hypothetical protein